MNKIEIKKAQKGDLIKSILESEPQLNYNIVKTALRKKDIKVNGKRIKDAFLLLGGETIEIFLPPAKEKEIPVAFEDENIIVVNKPQGLEVTIKDKVFFKSKCLEEYFTPFKAVHRLDKNTEGLVILAKNEKSYNALLKAFKNGEIHKHYLTLVAGKPKPEKANLEDYLVKMENGVKIFKTKMPNSVKIKTNYEIVESNNDCSMLDIELLTGKTHQIRAELAYHDIFIIGDEKYGSKTINKKFKIHTQKLCAYKLNFNFSKENFLNYLNKAEIKIIPSFKLLSL